MNILALDPANKTGFAHSNGEHGVWQLGKGDLGQQHDELWQHLQAVRYEWGIDQIAVEYASMGSMQAGTQAIHNERLGVIKLFAARNGCKVVTFSPMTIKAFATGNGHAKKPQMIAACKRLLNITTVSDDEADAIWILELAKRPDCWPVAKPKVKKARKAKVIPPMLWGKS